MRAAHREPRGAVRSVVPQDDPGLSRSAPRDRNAGSPRGVEARRDQDRSASITAGEDQEVGGRQPALSLQVEIEGARLAITDEAERDAPQRVERLHRIERDRQRRADDG